MLSVVSLTVGIYTVDNTYTPFTLRRNLGIRMHAGACHQMVDSVEVTNECCLTPARQQFVAAVVLFLRECSKSTYNHNYSQFNFFSD